ncbi:uncharacterized protein Fot_02367 [Forsythia ovata]|uniref:LysM domain-containing protein n=1 Tax=Forsythia ovata TaxID=205694 RepID=A0ABD1X9Q4_9LAMI
MPTSSSSSPSRSLPVSSESSTAVGVGVNGGPNYIVHHVSKFDTLAGVAIKYGVEVADIKRMNGLVTDLQMFALKTIHIPLPGRHPPSSSLSNGLDTPQRFAAVRKSSSTSSLQDSDNCTSSSVRPVPKWSLKPDFQALSTAAIFEGLPKPMGRKNKAALD